MLQYRLLGPLEVVDDDGRRVDIGGRQPRMLLAVLLVAGGRRVTVDALADAIWSGEPPASATGTVQSYVSRLRRRLAAALAAGSSRARRRISAETSRPIRRARASAGLADERITRMISSM